MAEAEEVDENGIPFVKAADGTTFRKGYSNKKETVAKTEPQQPNNAVSDGSSLSADEESGITSAEPNGKPTVSLKKLKERPLLWERGADSNPEDVATPTIATIKPQQGDEDMSRTKGQSNVSSDGKGNEKGVGAQGVGVENSLQEDISAAYRVNKQVQYYE